MNWLKPLKSWQKWGAVFGGIHLSLIGLVLLLVIYSKTYGGSGETGLLILLIDYPIYLIIDSVAPRFVDSRLLLPFLLVFGTLTWAGVGIVIGLIINTGTQKGEI